MKPLIGITGRKDTSARLLNAPMHSVGQTYTQAIQKAGGTPIILPPIMTEQDWALLVARLDGLLLSGGEDIAPASYGEPAEDWLGGIDETRDNSELGLVKQWVQSAKPMLAICRGHQLLNVALKGSLYQDIATYVPEALDHAYVPGRAMEQLVHSVKLEPDSRLANILGQHELDVNSVHHQAIKTLGNGLRLVGRSPDGVIEATEIPSHRFCISVQWHPEAMVKTSETMRTLFDAFVQATRSS